MRSQQRHTFNAQTVPSHTVQFIPIAIDTHLYSRRRVQDEAISKLQPNAKRNKSNLPSKGYLCLQAQVYPIDNPISVGRYSTDK